MFGPYWGNIGLVPFCKFMVNLQKRTRPISSQYGPHASSITFIYYFPLEGILVHRRVAPPPPPPPYGTTAPQLLDLLILINYESCNCDCRKTEDVCFFKIPSNLGHNKSNRQGKGQCVMKHFQYQFNHAVSIVREEEGWPASRQEKGFFEDWPVGLIFFFIFTNGGCTCFYEEKQKKVSCGSDWRANHKTAASLKIYLLFAQKHGLHLTQLIWSYLFQKYGKNSQNLSWCNPALNLKNGITVNLCI